MKIEPNKNKIIVKKSNIFFRDKNDEVLFINQIKNSSIYFDLKNLENVFTSKNKVFNVPYKFTVRNNKLNEKLRFKLTSGKLVLKIENELDYSKKNNEGILKITFKNRNNIFNYKLRENKLNFSLKDTNKNYNGLLEFKPFYLESNFNYQALKLKDFVNDFLIEIFKSQIFNNPNLNANINFNVKNIYDFDRFSNLFLKLKIEQGKMTLSDSEILWKENLNLSLVDSLLNFDKDKINFNGRMFVTIKNKDDFYRSFQITKDLRKDLKNIQFDFNYDFNENKIYFDNLRIDDNSNQNLDRLISKFNASDEKFFNKITFKTFVNKIFAAYFG